MKFVIHCLLLKRNFEEGCYMFRQFSILFFQLAEPVAESRILKNDCRVPADVDRGAGWVSARLDRKVDWWLFHGGRNLITVKSDSGTAGRSHNCEWVTVYCISRDCSGWRENTIGKKDQEWRKFTSIMVNKRKGGGDNSLRDGRIHARKFFTKTGKTFAENRKTFANNNGREQVAKNIWDHQSENSTRKPQAEERMSNRKEFIAKILGQQTRSGAKGYQTCLGAE